MRYDKKFLFFLKELIKSNKLSHDLESIVIKIINSGILIHNKIKFGNLNDNLLGNSGFINVQGENQQRLDIITNDILRDNLNKDPKIFAIASEEEENIVLCNEKRGKYLVLFDPLDGSSNVEVNISIGTIFSILPRKSNMSIDDNFLLEGNNQILAGYFLYGPQTNLVITFGEGVFLFTLNIDDLEFYLTKSDIKIPKDTKEFAINMSNYRHWEGKVQNYIEDLLSGTTGKRKKNFNMRWIASMVAEVHRILIRGGVFLYPRDSRDLYKNGKLRLLYELNPISFIIKQAGGESFNFEKDILDVTPEFLHQRNPVILGSKNEVDFFKQYY